MLFNPLGQKLSQKYFYPYLTRRLGNDDVLFLNWAYEEDQPDRFSIQLYHRTATQADLSGKRVLEVGCGHGGGASYLVRTLHPASYTGLDLNPAAIALCRKGTICPAWISCRATPRTCPSATNPSTR